RRVVPQAARLGEEAGDDVVVRAAADASDEQRDGDQQRRPADRGQCHEEPRCRVRHRGDGAAVLLPGRGGGGGGGRRCGGRRRRRGGPDGLVLGVGDGLGLGG